MIDYQELEEEERGNPTLMQTQVRAGQVRLLYKQLPVALVTGLLAAAVLAMVLWNVVSHQRILLWMGLFLMVSAGRFFLLTLYQRSEGRDEEAWASRFITGVACAGLVWGLAGVLLMPREPLTHRLLLAFILGWLMAGASISLSGMIRAYLLFCLPVVILLVTGLMVIRQGPFSLVISLLLVLFTAALIQLVRHLNAMMIESLRLRFEKNDLIRAMTGEITARKKSEGQLLARNQALEMLARQHSLKDVLRFINDSIEKEIPEAKSSILVLDEKRKHLFRLSAPSLPEAYSQAIHGIAIGPEVGSCGTAAYKNEPVIVEDIATDPLWRDHKDLALSHGLRACWSLPIRDHQGEVLGTFALYYDIPRKPNQDEINKVQAASHLAGVVIAQKISEKNLQRRAYYDLLTDLPNRALFLDRLGQTLAYAKRWKKKFALLFIDLDNFKIINDTLGHDAGDRVLKEVAERLHVSVRENDTVARLGGDEFTTIVRDVHSQEDASQVAQKILETLRKPVSLDGKNFEIGGSIGVSMYPTDGRDRDLLISKADIAMYKAKKDGGNTMIFCSSIR